MTVQGLGSYSTTNGFTSGDIALSYETRTISQRRARKLSLDKIVNAQTFDKAFAFKCQAIHKNTSCTRSEMLTE